MVAVAPHKPSGSKMDGVLGRVKVWEMPLAACRVRELELIAVTWPTKSSIKSKSPDGVPVRGRAAEVAAFVAEKLMAKVPLLRVRALFKLKLNDTPAV